MKSGSPTIRAPCVTRLRYWPCSFSVREDHSLQQFGDINCGRNGSVDCNSLFLQDLLLLEFRSPTGRKGQWALSSPRMGDCLRPIPLKNSIESVI